MADLNKVFLIGRLTQDPELRYTPNGAAVSDLRLATSRQYTGKDGTQQKETLYIDVTVWNRQAENCCQYLKKGRAVHVEGYLKMDTWEDRSSGEKRTKIKVEADRVQFLDGRRDDAGGSGPDQDDEYTPPAREPRRAAPAGEPRGVPNGARAAAGPGPNAAARRPAPPPTDDDEDIPF
jgi:single-strand DNA-binding protein